MFLTYTFLITQKEKKSWNTLNIHNFQYSFTKQSTLHKIVSQRICKSCPLQQQDNKKNHTICSPNLTPFYLFEVFHRIISTLLIVTFSPPPPWKERRGDQICSINNRKRAKFNISVDFSLVWEPTLMIFKLVPSLLKSCYFNLLLRQVIPNQFPWKLKTGYKTELLLSNKLDFQN